MHENEFEKKMQGKMEELQFAPSDAVWENVDKEINKDKKRRRPAFWLFFFLGLLLLGGGYYFTSNRNSIIHLTTAQQQINTERQNDQSSIVKVEKHLNENKITDHGLEKPTGATKALENKKEIAKPNQSSQKAVNLNTQHIKSILNNQTISGSSALKRGKEKTNAEKANVPKNGEDKPTEKNAVEKNESLVVDDLNKESLQIKENISPEKKALDSPVNKKTELAEGHKPSINDSASDTKIVREKKQQSKPSKWEIEFTESTGISNINQNLFRSTYVTNPSSYNALSSLPANGGPTVINTSSKINPDLSFTVGIFVGRHLSKRISFSAGINYHYYSTKIHVGHSVDSTIYVYAYGAQTPAIQAGSYYRNGTSSLYINRYHFIELPLSLIFQLNKSLKLPVMWEAGLSPAYLAGSNALDFDPVTNVYYKKNSLFNKLQLNAATAIMIGFHIHKNELQLGPQLEYGLTNILNKSTGNPEHLFYSGLRVSFIPRKK